MKNKLLLLFFVLAFAPAMCAENVVPTGANVSGVLVDSLTKQPVVYANVAVFSALDSSLAGGAITDSTGLFMITGLEKGDYFLRITFVGYGDLLLPQFTLARNEDRNFGVVAIKPSDFSLAGIDIVAEKSVVEYHLDKQVINAEAVQNASTGTAIDILRNSPSVVIDNDENITLRGNQGFILLINGTPTVQTPRDVLRQIPAAMVLKIEIITNPSARYDAEGVSGIINVILKQQKDKGFGALVNTRLGLNNKYGFDVSMNYNIKKWSFNSSVAFGDDKYKSVSNMERHIFYPDSVVGLKWKSNRDNRNEMLDARLSAEYQINKNNTFYVSAEMGRNNWQMDLLSEYTETIPGTENNYYLADYTSEYPGVTKGANVKFTSVLDTSGGKIEISSAVMTWNGLIAQSNSTFMSDNVFSRINQIQGTDFKEDAAQINWTINVDFTKNIFKNYKLETGYQFTYKPFDGQFDAQKYAGGAWVTDSAKTTDEWFLQRKNAGYVMLSRQFKAFEVQAGLRAEDFYSEFLLGNSSYGDVTYHDLYLFPSLHISKAFSQRSRWQASYSRRVNYPQDWMIGPTPLYSDGFMIQTGNANLRPELVDSYELSHIHMIGSGTMLNLTAFYRQINGQLVRTLTLNDAGLMEVNFANLSKSISYGVETGSNVQISKIFSANIAAGVYGVKNEGVVTGDTVNSSDISWNGRLMLNAKVTKTTRLQLTGFYNAASNEEQGFRKAQGLVGLSLRQDFLKGRLTATANINDLFNTFRYEMTISNPGYDTYMDYIPEYPRLTFGLSWKINNYKPQQIESQENMGRGGGM